MMRKTLLSFLAVLSAAVVFAADVGGEYTLLVGETLRLDANGLNRVSVFTPGIVDVVKTTKAGVEIIGKTEGETVLELGTPTGKHAYRLKVHAQDVDEAMSRVKKLVNDQLGFRDITIAKNQLTNRLIMEGSASEEDLQRIRTSLGAYATMVDDFMTKAESEDVVEIAVKILEVNRDGTDKLGIKWPGSLSYGETVSEDGYVRTMPNWKTARTDLNPLFGFMEEQTRSGLSATLNFLITETNAKILSEPTIACVSGKEASLQIGGSTPILTTAGSGTEASTAVQYVNYGIGLNVSPVVRPDDGLIEVNVQVNVSDLEKLPVTLGSSDNTTASAPSTSTRTTSTVMLMEDGQTMTISGLIKDRDDETLSKFPWLCNVPVLGKFFTDSTKGKTKTELVILLTPRVKKVPRKQAKKLTVSDEAYAEGTRVISNDPQSRRDEGIASYAAKVREQILAVLTYPAEARAAGWEADVTVSVHLSEDGYILGVEKKKASAHEMFDEQLVATIKAMKYLTPFPGSVAEKELWLDIPFSFRMTEN